MKIKYRILKTFPEEYSITVRFFTDTLSEYDLRTQPDDKSEIPENCRTDYYINVPNNDLTEDEFHEFLVNQAPIGWLDQKERIKNKEENKSLIIAEKIKGITFEKEHIKTVNDVTLTDEDIQAKLEKIMKG